MPPLKQAEIRTASGKATWIAPPFGAAQEPGLQGQAAFGKTHHSAPRSKLRAQPADRNNPPAQVSVINSCRLGVHSSARAGGRRLFESVQKQLQENHRARGKPTRRALLTARPGGLCALWLRLLRQGHQPSSAGHKRDYAYYRCIGTDAYRFGGERICDNLQVRTDLLIVVWDEVCDPRDPQRLQQNTLVD
jgi:site-specific DNA recombinase